MPRFYFNFSPNVLTSITVILPGTILLKGHTSEEKLIGAAKQVAGSTAQLLLACKVKADPESKAMKRLEAASNAVRKATDNLVKAAQTALEQEDDSSNVDLNKSAVISVVEVIFLVVFRSKNIDQKFGRKLI